MYNRNLWILIIIIVLIAIIYYFYSKKSTTISSSSDISKLTDQWIHDVTVAHDPNAISKLFCPDGILIGTVSKITRRGADIKTYFDYFAKLPGIKVIDRQYKINQVAPNVYSNTAFITWYWDGLEQPVVARMTFLYRDNCIFQLHSSVLPELNQQLLDISGSR
jgi:hypothetical protein